MRKPWWVRVFGWAGWVMAAVSGLFFYGATQAPMGVMGLYSLPAFIFAAIAISLFVLWFVMSFVLYAAAHVGAKSAAGLRDSLAGRDKQAGPVPVRKAAAAEPWDNPATKIRCDGCGRYHALLFCAKHDQFLCFPCSSRHDEAGCMYIAAGRRLDEAHKEPAAARPVGSVLGI